MDITKTYKTLGAAALVPVADLAELRATVATLRRNAQADKVAYDWLASEHKELLKQFAAPAKQPQPQPRPNVDRLARRIRNGTLTQAGAVRALKAEARR